MRARPASSLALAAGLVLLTTTFALADQVVLKDGRIITGTVQVDEAKGEVRVKRSGATMTFKMSEVARVDRDEAAPAEPAKPDEPAKPAGKAAAVVIPIHGNIDTHRAIREFDDVLEEALALQPKIIVFEISSSGGAILVARHFSKRIRSLTGTRTAAFVWGPVKGAFSAAAYVALSCDRIYMAPGQAIGAAVAWKAADDGTPKNVSAKFDSAWQAEFRAAAEANGHPTTIAGAMVSSEHGVVELTIAGKKAYITATAYEEEQRLRQGEDPQPGTSARVLCKPGSVLTLTSREARRVGVSRGTAADTPEFLTKLGIPAASTRRLSNPLKTARQIVRKEQAKLDEAIADFNKNFKKLVAEAPGNHTYETTEDGLFKDNGREWRRRTKAALKYIKRSLRELEEVKERMQNPDLSVDRRGVTAYESKLKSFEKELRSVRYTKSPPGGRRR